MKSEKHLKPVRVQDILSSALRPPFSLKLARAVTGPFLPNGAKYVGIHSVPNDFVGKFFVTSIIDETTADIGNWREGKLMIQGGTQYGCAFKCPFCVYSGLPLYRNLTSEEMVDLFRLSLYLHRQHNGDSFYVDERKIMLKFTDNGEPLENPEIIDALDKLVSLFGVEGKVLLIKISTIFADTKTSRETFERLVEWQRMNMHCASIHLQISRAPYKNEKSLSGAEICESISKWSEVNPYDRVCIAPGIVSGYKEEKFLAFCEELLPVKEVVFFRLSVIKPSKKSQEQMILPCEDYENLAQKIIELGFKMSPLELSKEYVSELRGAGTLAYLPNEDVEFFEPSGYRIQEYDLSMVLSEVI